MVYLKSYPYTQKGTKKQIKNFRPISNLCSLTKVFEKLILARILEIEENANEDLMKEGQHGYKKAHLLCKNL